MTTLVFKKTRNEIDFEDGATLIDQGIMTFDSDADAFNYLFNDLANAIDPRYYDVIEGDCIDEDEDPSFIEDVASWSCEDLARHIGDNDLGFEIEITK